MRKLALVVAVMSLTACSTVGTATGTVGSAAKGTWNAVTGLFTN